MGVLSDLGLGAARALRARLGPRGALRLLVPAILGAQPSPARAAALVVALECAAELEDARAIEALAPAWSLERAGARTADVAPVCARLAAHRAGAALALADANVARRDDAESRALRAALHERRGAIDDAIADWRAALDGAERAAAADSLAARVELARALARHPGRRLEAAEIVAAIPDARETSLDPRARLLVAIARLGAPGRYARVRGLDTLADLASEPDSAVARAAIRAACAHVDASGRGVTAVELERVQRVAQRWPDADVRARLAAVLDALAVDEGPAARSAALVRAAALHGPTRDRLDRARAVLSGGAAGPRSVGDGASWCALAAVAALRGGLEAEARARLRELRAAGVGQGDAAAWTAAGLALERPALRDDALALAEALLATRSAPPRGFQHVAIRIERAGSDRLALRAWARAHEQREAGALEARSAALVRAAWRAAAAGRRDEAIAWLAEARVLAGA